MQTKRTKHQRRGFTLMEILVAGVVLATGAVLVIEGITTNVAAGEHVVHQINAIRVAENKLSRLAAQQINSTEGEEVVGRSDYQWTILVEPIRLHTTRATCTVQWYTGMHHYEISLERFIHTLEESP